MKLVSSWAGILFVLAGCSPAQAPAGEVSEAPDSVRVAPIDEWTNAEDFAQDDVAIMYESREAWIAGFASGNAEPLDFIFEKDAVLPLPEDIAAMSAEEFVANYVAEISFDESSVQFMTAGGDPRVMTKLPWVSYRSDYTLTMTPKAGGEPIENRGTFMTRFHRQPDDSLQVIRGPSVGDPAPLFALNLMKGGGGVQLADLFGEKPTVLIFGSYT